MSIAPVSATASDTREHAKPTNDNAAHDEAGKHQRPPADSQTAAATPVATVLSGAGSTGPNGSNRNGTSTAVGGVAALNGATQTVTTGHQSVQPQQQQEKAQETSQQALAASAQKTPASSSKEVDFKARVNGSGSGSAPAVSSPAADLATTKDDPVPTSKTTRSAKTRTPRPPGKQKRKTAQAGAKGTELVHTGPSTAGGTIGAAPDHAVPGMASAGGGARKVIPEHVLPFPLPCSATRPESPLLNNASLEDREAYLKRTKLNNGAGKAVEEAASASKPLARKASTPQARSGARQAKQPSPETSDSSDSDTFSSVSDSDEDEEQRLQRREERKRKREPASVGESLVLLQSLRQSRLSHLSSLLPPFSQRVRSGMIYPNVLPLSLLHGLNPREPHVLIQLGRADIQVGPHIFVKTKFWEVRPDVDQFASHSYASHLTGPYGEMKRPSGASVQKHEGRIERGEQTPESKPVGKAATSRGSSIAATAGTGSKAASESSPTAKSTQQRRPSASTLQLIAPKPVPPADAGPAGGAIPATSAAPASKSTASAPAPIPLGPGFESRPTGPSASQSRGSAQAQGQAQAPASAQSPGQPRSQVQAAVSQSSSIAPAAQTSVSPVNSVTAAAKAPASIPAKPTATFSATATLPRPPALVQTSGPMLTTATVQHPSATATTTTVSQHVQFAPARLSPISQPVSQQSAAKPVRPMQAGATSSAPPKPDGPSAPGAPGNAAVKPPASTATSSTGPSTASGGSSSGVPGQIASTSATRPMPPPRQLQPTPAQAKPPPSGSQPAIDAVLVSRVNATAALNPELQQLLHVAASGKASPEQLKSLGVWIQAITAQLREDEARATASAGSTTDSNSAKKSGDGTAAAAPKSKGKGKDGAADASVEAEKPKKGRKSKSEAEVASAKAAKKAAKAEEKEAKKKAAAAAKAEAKAAAAAQKQQQQQLRQQQARARQLPPGWPTDGPPRPPIIVVEFRENPSMRFILPLWKCVVERREGLDPTSLPKMKRERGFFDDFIDDDEEDEQGVEPELKLSFFVPSIGSDAAGRSGTREVEESEAARRKPETAASPGKPGQAGGAASAANREASGPLAGSGQPTTNEEPNKTQLSALNGQKKLSKKAQKMLEAEAKAKAQAEADEAAQGKKHEQFPATWSIKGGVTESMWEAFGRVPGVITNAIVRPVKVEPEIELAPDVAEFLVPEIKYHLLDQPEEDIKIHKETVDTFTDLYSQLPDRRFIMPCISPMHIPLGLEEHLADKFAIRPQAVAARPVAKRKAGAPRDDADLLFGFGATSGDPHEIKQEAEATPSKPPKRKRHVATHNPDGSIKSCGACGKTKTPMWRRGPKGPSQLCNACGARWKAGRLVVPEVAPPPVIETESDRNREEKENVAKQQHDDAVELANGQLSGGVERSSFSLAPTAMSGAVFIPMGASGAAMSMPASTTFTPVTGIDMTRGPSPFDAHAHSGVASSGLMMTPPPGPFAHHLVGMEGTPMDLDPSGGGIGVSLDHPHYHGTAQQSPSPFIRSPNPFSGPETMPASVDPSVLFGGSSNGSRSSSR